jgi:hypothetical protein
MGNVIFWSGLFLVVRNSQKIFVLLFAVEVLRFSILISCLNFAGIIFFLLLLLIVRGGIILTVLALHNLSFFFHRKIRSYIF